MSTRSCILLKVRKEDMGKVISFRKAALPVPLEEWTRDEGKEISKPVKIEKDEERVIHYANREGEEWDDIHPRLGDTATALTNIFNSADAEYAYLFDGDTCEWCYKPLNGTNNGFEPL